eukprot:scaffold52525_cov75-Phaeocystis_antarctica.AAC.11
MVSRGSSHTHVVAGVAALRGPRARCGGGWRGRETKTWLADGTQVDAIPLSACARWIISSPISTTKATTLNLLLEALAWVAPVLLTQTMHDGAGSLCTQ